MGVRLYPITDDRAAIEKLAGVPAGTYDRLDELERRIGVDERGIDFATRERRYDDLYNALSDDGDLDVLHGFLLFGWGKFHTPAGSDLGCCGRLTGEPARQLLDLNGIDVDLDLCGGGVSWS